MTMQRIGIIGSGDVGQALGRAFAAKGHEVKLGTRDPKNEDVQSWMKEVGAKASVGTNAEAATFGDVVILATAWTGTQNALKLAGPENLRGKVVIDVTNPLDHPEGGGMPSLSIGYPDSAGKLVQQWLPGARVVKAFNIISNHRMANPHYPGEKADMLICGDDQKAKDEVTRLLNSFDWPVLDMGGIDQAYLLEAVAMTWIAYGFRTNTWDHAFKLIRQ